MSSETNSPTKNTSKKSHNSWKTHKWKSDTVNDSSIKPGSEKSTRTNPWSNIFTKEVDANANGQKQKNYSSFVSKVEKHVKELSVASRYAEQSNKSAEYEKGKQDEAKKMNRISNRWGKNKTDNYKSSRRIRSGYK